MNAFERWVDTISATMQTPTLYGWFHLLFWGLVILLTTLLLVFLRDSDVRTERRILLAVLLVMLLAECYKQLVFSMEVEDGLAVWEYDWYYFPFQFCSTPLFVLPFAAFLPEGRVRSAALSFLAGYSLFAGLAVMVYPGDVFVETIGINLQTMIHHGLQVVVGIYLAVRYRSTPFLRKFLMSIPVFLLLLAVAILMNITMRADGLNMFFVGPYVPTTLPILSAIERRVPYAVFLAVYILGFTLAAFLTLLIVRAVAHLVAKGCGARPRSL